MNTHPSCFWHRRLVILLSSFLLAAFPGRAATRHVWAGSLAPASPYDEWSSAAHSIQEAVNGAADGDRILVTNGVYSTGGKITPGGAVSNRVVAVVAVTIESVSGPEVTMIVGQGPLGTNAVRCVYLEGGAVLSGFTLTNGYTRTTGNTWLDRDGGGAYLADGILTNCIVRGCQAHSAGGGIEGGAAYDCRIRGNVAGGGGGADDCVLTWCTVEKNQATDSGGGLYAGSADNCVIRDNRAGAFGGGAYDARLANSLICDNAADIEGGGVCWNTIENCTIVHNTAPTGGGVSYATVEDSIVYFNISAFHANYDENSTFEYSCTTPDPGGYANMTDDPALVDAGHLSASSPCIGKGLYGIGTDLDGDSWTDPISIGCDQYAADGATGPLAVTVQASLTNAAVGFAFDFEVFLQGKATSNLWRFGDGGTLTDAAFATHTWNVPGLYPVVLTAYNNTFTAGISATTMVSVVVQPVHYVNPQNLAAQFPFTNWPTAATHIQDAINACVVPGSKVIVADGVYATDTVLPSGCVLPARFAISNAATVESVNGPAVTTIVGQGPIGPNAVRCVFLDRETRLSGFTLSNGCTQLAVDDRDSSGAGAYALYASLSNCVLVANTACSSGGGVYFGTLDRCMITSNAITQVGGSGGGACLSRLRGCTVIGNRSRNGGGMYDGAAEDSVLSHNIASDSGGGAYGSELTGCTLSWNITTNYTGGALYSGTAIRSVIAGNIAVKDDGGGADESTLIGCLVVGNTSGHEGGGACYCTVVNSTVCDNTAVMEGGGTHRGHVTNCIVYYNTCVNVTNANYSPATLRYCCTTPAVEGAGNFTNEPGFVNRMAGNYRLRYGSTCLDAGLPQNAEAASTDLDGVPRPQDGNFDGTAGWDLGAYEYNAATADSDEDQMLDAWEVCYGLNPTNAADATVNSDGDSSNNYEEWVADTNPTNPASCFRIRLASNQPPWTVVFEASARRLYTLEYRTNLTGSNPWTTVGNPWRVPGNGGTMTLCDTTAPPVRFYHVKVEAPGPGLGLH